MIQQVEIGEGSLSEADSQKMDSKQILSWMPTREYASAPDHGCSLSLFIFHFSFLKSLIDLLESQLEYLKNQKKMVAAKVDKLGGWPYWTHDPERPKFALFFFLNLKN